MRTIIILLLLVLVTIGCKENSKQTEDITSTQEKTETIDDKDVKDISSFLQLSEKPNSLIVNKNLGDVAEIRNMALFKDSTEVTHFVFELFNIDQEIDQEKFRLNIRITPFQSDSNLLREDTKNQNLNYDSWFSDFKITASNQNNYAVFPIKTGISKFKKIELYLYDQEQGQYLNNMVSIDYEFNKFLLSDNADNTFQIEGVLGREFSVNSLKIYKNEDSKGMEIAYRLSSEYSDDLFDNKRIMVNIYPTEAYIDLLREDSKNKNVVFDSWYADMNVRDLGDSKFIFMNIPSEILDFQKMETYIYDEAQKRFVGLPLVLTDISLEIND